MHSDRNNTVVNVAIAVLLAAVFLLEVVTPLGFAEWIFYVVPVGLCLLQARPSLPLLVAGASTLLVAAGYFYSPLGTEWLLSFTNRTIGVGTIWFVAFMVRQNVLARARLARSAEIEAGQSRVARAALGDLPPDQIAGAHLAALADVLDAHVGALYRLEAGTLLRVAVYAMPAPHTPAETVRLGEGLLGQAARSNRTIVLREVPAGYLAVTSASGSATPQALVVSPITADGVVFGVIELGFMRVLEDADVTVELLAGMAEELGISLRSALYRERVDELLVQTQRQSAELEERQEELKAANEELEEQSKALQESQARLENQQAELEESNAQLEAYTSDLERQKQELLRTQSALSASARELERSSRYKSEFLANMSHELRTPLNSSLILAKVLSDNAPGNLTEEQVGYARVIQSANNDLLALINDILDLAKIEAGRVELERETVPLAELAGRLQASFKPVAAEKELQFRIELSVHAPASLVTDSRRLEQILRNLLSNAFKFTDTGSVLLRVAPGAEGTIAFAVEDTGIGIAQEEQGPIFEAFRQADGTASRKHGGSGLGLSISRELAALLGGRIGLQSTPGVGSVFTLTIPVELEAPAGDAQALQPQIVTDADARTRVPPAAGSVAEPARAAASPHAPAAATTSARVYTASYHIDDDRNTRKRERLILVVEDDTSFAQILYGLAHELDLDCIHTASGSEALALAKELNPSGIVLDVGLPDDSGLSVLERLKRDRHTRHIPIHMVSVDDYTQPALELGAIGYTMKPAAAEQLTQAIRNLQERVENRVRNVLVIEDDEALRSSIAVLLQAQDVEVATAGTVAEALQLLGSRSFDCLVMDLALPDGSGFDLLERIASGGAYTSPPVIVYTGRSLTAEDEQRLRRYSRSIIIKGVRSPERLLDEVTLFLHRVEATLPPEQQKLLRQARQRDTALDGRSILLAEDDVRNVYALSSLFEPLGVQLEIARNGKQALDAVKSGRRVDLMLMDVMMPEMDGLSAIRAIRALPAGTKIPIIALTAKAMPEDRLACLEAGANDYISKPIDVDRLLSLCRVWVPK